VSGAGTGPSVDVVIPTAGRASLPPLLAALRREGVPRALGVRLIVVDDRPRPQPALALGDDVEVVRGPARGPAGARNAGWRAATAEWVAFLDDDVVPDPGWAEALVADLARVGDEVAASQGWIGVPIPEGRAPTDWERNVAGLENARWATADMAFRRAALAAVGGFDERFERAYREDADLALRVLRAGWRLERGERAVRHPVRPADPWVSVRLQAGNAADVLMHALHGPRWREEVGAPPGRLRRHLVTVAAGAGALAAAKARRRGPLMAGLLGWAVGTGELAWARIAPGPRTPAEVGKMLLTSVAIPPAATWHLLRALARRRSLLADGERAPRPEPRVRAAERCLSRPDAVLLDRDGTLVVDVPYNGDPSRVEPVPGARSALDRLRAAGLPLGVVSNQSGVGRGVLAPEDVARVNRRIEELLGPLGPWAVCPHGPDDGCACRKPAPGLVLEAASRLGVAPERCALIGDIGADVEAARAAGARGVLVPTPKTRAEEVAAAHEVVPDLEAAVDLLIGEPA